MGLWELVINGVTGLGGAFIGGRASVKGQVTANSGALERDRQARQDADDLRRREIEQETLLALQDALGDHCKEFARVRAMQSHGQIASSVELLEHYATIMKLAHRTLADTARDAALRYIQICQLSVGRPTSETETVNGADADVVDAFAKAQVEAGEALRRVLG